MFHFSLLVSFKLSHHCWPSLLLTSRFLDDKDINYGLFLIWQGTKVILLQFTQALPLEQHKPYVVCCLIVSKDVVSTVFQNFKMKIRQPYLYCCSGLSKYSKCTLFFCFYALKIQHLPFIHSFSSQDVNRTVFLALKPGNTLSGNFCLVDLLLNKLFVLFLQFN